MQLHLSRARAKHRTVLVYSLSSFAKISNNLRQSVSKLVLECHNYSCNDIATRRSAPYRRNSVARCTESILDEFTGKITKISTSNVSRVTKFEGKVPERKNYLPLYFLPIPSSLDDKNGSGGIMGN